MIKIGSLFSGIGGFELGLERAIPGAETIWQVEQNKYCQSILKKHWPNATIYDDVRNITQHNVGAVDILCGGFPCQDISTAGKGEGLHGKKSGLWWEMLRIISELRPRIVILENVAAILFRGGCEVVGSLTEIGYCTEWTIISARDQGAPHLRKRWFAVAYPADSNSDKCKAQSMHSEQTHWKTCQMLKHGNRSNVYATNTDDKRFEKRLYSIPIQKSKQHAQGDTQNTPRTYWQKNTPESPLCHVDDGIPQRVARLKALGNAIVPQCSEWVGQQIVKSGLLQELS